MREGRIPAMARTLASLPVGSRITDYISLGVVSRAVPREKIDSILAETGKTSIRQRELPARLVVYYVIALALYMHSSYREVLRCLLEGIQWLTKPDETVKAAGKSGISQARSRLGAEPLRRLYEQVVVPIASKNTRGAWYRKWRLISLDGSTLDIADTKENEDEFGRPPASRGSSAYPQLRFVALLENGTHILLGGRMGSYAISEVTLAKLLHDGVDLRSRTVREVMGKPLPQVDAAIDLSEPYRLLLAGHGGVIITEGGKPIGFLARIDLVEFWTVGRKK